MIKTEDMIIVYIAGKVTGLPIEEVREKFLAAEDRVRQMGFIPQNPVAGIESGDLQNEPYDIIMEKCIGWLKGSHKIYMLPCWIDSNGARIEHAVALKMGIEIIYA